MKRLVVLLTGAIMVVGCGGTESDVDPLGALIDTSRPGLAAGEDVWDVTVCHVPIGVQDPLYADVDARMTRTAADIAEVLAPVSEYFDRASGGAYRLRLVPSTNDVSISVDETSRQCIDRALAQSSSDGVIVVGDAQHDESADGGRGGPGRTCSGACPASETGRYVYVGAADFMSPNDSDVPFDLVEHELGHGLDWPHSSRSREGLDGVVYDSPYDLMSDSAAPRLVDASLRHGPGVLAINLVASGWIERDLVAEMAESGAVTLGPRSEIGGSDPLLVVLPLDEDSMLSVEFVTAAGDDAFHGSDFVVVHRIDDISLGGFLRRQFLVSPELRVGDSWTGDGYSVTVVSIADVARLEISAGA
jgi:hypothetical protein